MATAVAFRINYEASSRFCADVCSIIINNSRKNKQSFIIKAATIMEVALAPQPKTTIFPKVSTFEGKLKQVLDYDTLLQAISILP